MTNMTFNTFNADLVKRIVVDVADATRITKSLIQSAAALPKYMTDNIASEDYTMRMAMQGNKSCEMRVIEGLTHGAWTEFFAQHNAHHLLINGENAVMNKYVYADSVQRKHYNDVKELVQFNYVNAWDFFNDHLHITPARRSQWLTKLLGYTGANWKKRSDTFKTKLTMRDLDSYGIVSRELARSVYAICLALNIEFTFDKLYTELRNNRRIDGTQFYLIDGLELTVELHMNGNSTLRMSKELVDQLNAML